MQVLGIGNVTGCNQVWIFLNDEGKQSSLKATVECLEIIREVALRDYEFYNRMYEELQIIYDKKNTLITNRYHFISEEMVKEAFKEDRKKGLSLSWEKDSNNEECLRQYGKLSGISETKDIIFNKKWEAHKILKQAEGALPKPKK